MLFEAQRGKYHFVLLEITKANIPVSLENEKPLLILLLMSDNILLCIKILKEQVSGLIHDILHA